MLRLWLSTNLILNTDQLCLSALTSAHGKEVKHKLLVMMELNLNILLLRSQLSQFGLTQGQEGKACSCFALPWRSVTHNGFIFVYNVSRRPGIIFHVDIESPQFWSPKKTTPPPAELS